MNTSLKAYRILNTRPIDQAKKLSEALRARGADVIECPMIEIKATQNCRKSSHIMSDFDFLIFTSMHAVDYFFKEYHPEHTHMPQIIAIGQGTASALVQRQIKPIQPNSAHSEALLQLPILQDINHKKIALIKGLGGRRLIKKTLQARNALVSVYCVYRRVLPLITDETTHLLQQHYDIIIITSATSFKHLYQYINKETLTQSLFMVISPRIALYAQRAGCRHIMICPYEHLIETLEEYAHA